MSESNIVLGYNVSPPPPRRTGLSEELMAKGTLADPTDVIVFGRDEREWELELSPHFFIRVDSSPRRWHRWLQRICFGFKWHYRRVAD